MSDKAVSSYDNPGTVTTHTYQGRVWVIKHQAGIPFSDAGGHGFVDPNKARHYLISLIQRHSYTLVSDNAKLLTPYTRTNVKPLAHRPYYPRMDDKKRLAKWFFSPRHMAHIKAAVAIHSANYFKTDVFTPARLAWATAYLNREWNCKNALKFNAYQQS